jgi:serine/threonine protein phosphatase PrpC
MRHIVYEAPSMQRACQNLVTAANGAGGPDNISVILVQLIG